MVKNNVFKRIWKKGRQSMHEQMLLTIWMIGLTVMKYRDVEGLKAINWQLSIENKI